MYVGVLVVLLGKDSELQLRVPLKGEDLEKFNALKKRFGLQSNTETFRTILTRLYEQLGKEGKFFDDPAVKKALQQ